MDKTVIIFIIIKCEFFVSAACVGLYNSNNNHDSKFLNFFLILMSFFFNGNTI